ncbi:hypothetical protein TRAPUB_11881, partial [Trametes pubescens]
LGPQCALRDLLRARSPPGGGGRTHRRDVRVIWHRRLGGRVSAARVRAHAV